MKKFEFIYKEGFLTLHLREKLKFEEERKFLRETNHGDYTVREIVINGIEGIQPLSPYKICFKIARLYMNDADIAEIGRKIIDILGRETGEEAIEVLTESMNEVIPSTKLAMQLQQETDFTLEMCEAALEANDYQIETARAWLDALH